MRNQVRALLSQGYIHLLSITPSIDSTYGHKIWRRSYITAAILEHMTDEVLLYIKLILLNMNKENVDIH